jgi:hypothetical protein
MNRVTTIASLVQQVQLSVRTHCHHMGLISIRSPSAHHCWLLGWVVSAMTSRR